MSILDKMICKHIMMLPKCMVCKNCFNDAVACKAFPDGIPDEKISAPEAEECGNGIKFEEED